MMAIEAYFARIFEGDPCLRVRSHRKEPWVAPQKAHARRALILVGKAFEKRIF